MLFQWPHCPVSIVVWLGLRRMGGNVHWQASEECLAGYIALSGSLRLLPLYKGLARLGLRLQWHLVHYLVHYFWPDRNGPCSKVVHLIGNGVPFGKQPYRNTQGPNNHTPHSWVSAVNMPGRPCLSIDLCVFCPGFCQSFVFEVCTCLTSQMVGDTIYLKWKQKGKWEKHQTILDT